MPCLGENSSRDTHQGLHHVGLVVPQRFHDVEHVNDVLLLDHLTHAADGTEGPTAASPISKHRGKGKSDSFLGAPLAWGSGYVGQGKVRHW